MEKLTIEILGPWLLNKGDALNLWSVATRFRDSSTLAVSSRLGLEKLPKEPNLKEIRWRPGGQELGRAVRSASPKALLRWVRNTAVLSVNPRSLLRARGIVSGGDVDVLLDCSGYAYGDVWSTRRLEERTVHLAKLKRQGALAVMLPQALGPFEKPEMRASAQKMFTYYDLIYARDEVSLGHVQGLNISGPVVAMAPDITHLLDGPPPTDAETWASRVCIVPNARMIDRTSERTGNRYFDFLLQCVEGVRSSGLEPCLLIHEENDRVLAQEIKGAAKISLPVVDEDAVVTKGIIGASYAVIGSRYHALISSLSQAVPVIGTSWSHKYDELFDDYGCSQHLMSTLDTEVVEKVEEFLDPSSRKALHERQAERAEAQKAKVEDLWERVESMMQERG